MQNFENQSQDNQLGSHGFNMHNFHTSDSSAFISRPTSSENKTQDSHMQCQNDVSSLNHDPRGSCNNYDPFQQSDINPEPISSHKLISIRNIPIWFPYEPYEAQVNYMGQGNRFISC